MSDQSATISTSFPATPRPAHKPVQPAAPTAAACTKLLLQGSILPTLLRLAAPNVVVNVVLIAVTATVDAHFVVRWGRAPSLASRSFSR